jgi:spore maturation protein CgeB
VFLVQGMRILLLQNNGRYGVLGSMTKALHRAFLRQGVDSYLFDAWDQGPQALFRCIEEWKPEYTFGINLFAHKELPFASYGINHICLCVDSLPHYKELAAEEFDLLHTIVLFTDAWSSEVFEAKAGRSFWFPHAISEEELDELTAKSVPWKDRAYEVVMVGSYIDYEQELNFWKTLLPKKQIDALNALVEEILEDPSSSFLHKMLAFLNHHRSIDTILKENSLSTFHLLASIELYMRGLDRKRLVHAFKGMEVHIFGEGWPPSSAYTIHPPLPFSSILDIYAQSKVVLNSAPMIRRGYHERLFLGLAAGSVVVTSKLDVSNLNQAKVLVDYTTSSLSLLPDRLKNLRSPQPPREWLKKNHTWDVRVKNFLSSLK